MIRITILLSLLTILISCQKNETTVIVNIKNKTQDKNLINFVQIGNPYYEIKMDDKNQYLIKTNDLKEGYYKIDNSLVFLAPGFDLQIKISDSLAMFEDKRS